MPNVSKCTYSKVVIKHTYIDIQYGYYLLTLHSYTSLKNNNMAIATTIARYIHVYIHANFHFQTSSYLSDYIYINGPLFIIIIVHVMLYYTIGLIINRL